MKRRTFIGLVLGLLVGGGAVTRQALKETDTDRLLAMVNRRRQARGLHTVRVDLRLNRTATAWAEHMAATQTLEHSQLRMPAGARWVGEIIGVGNTFRSVMAAWIDSDEHRRIMLFNRARFAGAGAEYDGNRWWLVVQFGY